MHLRLHTEYSLVDGLLRVEPLMAAVAAAGMPAIGLSDHGNLFAMIKFYSEAHSCGVKPVIGVDAWLRQEGERAEPARLTSSRKTRRLSQLTGWCHAATETGCTARCWSARSMRRRRPTDRCQALRKRCRPGAARQAQRGASCWRAAGAAGDRYYPRSTQQPPGRDEHLAAVLELLTD